MASEGKLFYIALIVVELFLLFLGFSNYFIAKSLLIISKKTGNIWFKISGILTKIGAFTMPVAVGMLPLALAQPFFLIGCIVYKPAEQDHVKVAYISSALDNFCETIDFKIDSQDPDFPTTGLHRTSFVSGDSRASLRALRAKTSSGRSL
jgi:hypothetical protein